MATSPGHQRFVWIGSVLEFDSDHNEVFTPRVLNDVRRRSVRPYDGQHLEIGAGILGWLGLLVYDMGTTYGNVIGAGLPSIAAIVAVVAAGFGAGAVSLWTRNSRETLLAFISVLVLGAVIFGVVWLIL